MTKEIWDRKYLPSKASEYIFQNSSHQELISKFINEKTFPHLLLSGHRGTGKTSLAYLLKSELHIEDIDFLKINASDENNVDTVRSKIKDFISSMAMSGDFKIVFLDEADYLSAAAQAILRNMMEEYSDNAKFILTCNKPQKIIPELKSRCLEIKYDALDKDEMTIRFGVILKNEKVKISDLDLLDEYVNSCYPDFRKLLITAQHGVKDGVLQPFHNMLSDTSEYMVKVIGYIESDDWVSARTFLAENVPDDKWEECYRFLYDYLHEIGKFTTQKNWKAGIVIISDHLYRHAFVADPEMNFAACLIRLSEV